jgi:hypothetical protein
MPTPTAVPLFVGQISNQLHTGRLSFARALTTRGPGRNAEKKPPAVAGGFFGIVARNYPISSASDWGKL